LVQLGTPASSVLVNSKPRPLSSTAQAMRASLFASAIASTLWCNRLLAASIQGFEPVAFPILYPDQHNLCRLHEQNAQVTIAPLEILPGIVRSPVDSCLGTSPSQAPKSRPLEIRLQFQTRLPWRLK
jgi:hypothetical protein